MPLRGAASPVALRMIREAFEDLERAVAPTDAKEFGNTTLQNVQKAALEIENRMAARQSLRNMRRIMPLFTGLGHYAKTIEVLCNGTPFLPWIWAPIKLILTVSSDYVDAFDIIIKHYARISESLSRFEILKDTFNNNVEFQNVLAVYYCDILQFHKAGYKFIRRRNWSLFFHTSFGRFRDRFDDIIANLKSHENLLDKTANAINISEARETRIRLEQQRKDHMEAIAKEEKRKTSQQYEEIVAWLRVDQSEQALILDNVMEETLRFSSGCDWILKLDRIKAWMQRNSDVPFLWLQGKPGSGKSVLAGHIIGFLQAATHTDHSVLVSHFCTYSYASSTKYDLILRSLLLQILRANDDLVAYVFRLKETEFTMRAPTTKSLEKLLQTIAGALPQTPGEAKYIHLVLDGLDECEEEKQGRLINLLGQLVAAFGSPSPAIYKVLLLSRNSSFLIKRLRKTATVVSLTEEGHHLEKAIQLYAYSKLGALRPRLMGMGIGDADIRDMATTIAQKSDGMYIWARLVIEYISTNLFYNKDEILHAAEELPSALSEFYERILIQILGKFDKRSTERLKSIFGWIAYAKRPLRMFEFQSALAFGLGDPDIAEIVPAYLFGMCAPLIEERNDSTFAFIHVSVKEYLKSQGGKNMISEDAARYEHGMASITCLLSGLTVFDSTFSEYERSLRVLRGLHAFHVYSNEFWLDHVLAATTSNQLSPSSSLYSLMSLLASKLLELDSTSTERREIRDTATVDNMLKCLKPFRGLYIYAKIVLQARSAKSLEEISQRQGNDGDGQEIPPDILSAILSLYQSTVQSLLSVRTFPNTSMEDLARFKKSHKTLAFTCRLNGCARSSTGFENERLRAEHEQSHVRRLYCEHSGCQYPPFTSTRALRSHTAKWHDQANQEKPKRSIRTRKTLQAPQFHLPRLSIPAQTSSRSYPPNKISSISSPSKAEVQDQLEDSLKAYSPRMLNHGDENPTGKSSRLENSQSGDAVDLFHFNDDDTTYGELGAAMVRWNSKTQNPHASGWQNSSDPGEAMRDGPQQGPGPRDYPPVNGGRIKYQLPSHPPIINELERAARMMDVDEDYDDSGEEDNKAGSSMCDGPQQGSGPRDYPPVDGERIEYQPPSYPPIMNELEWAARIMDVDEDSEDSGEEDNKAGSSMPDSPQQGYGPRDYRLVDAERIEYQPPSYPPIINELERAARIIDVDEDYEDSGEEDNKASSSMPDSPQQSCGPRDYPPVDTERIEYQPPSHPPIINELERAARIMDVDEDYEDSSEEDNKAGSSPDLFPAPDRPRVR